MQVGRDLSITAMLSVYVGLGRAPLQASCWQIPSCSAGSQLRCMMWGDT